jgi:hypothetical protein
MAKKRVLPKDFFRSMGTATLDELIAVYDDHLLTAHQSGDSAKRTPLFWALTPNGLVEWLVRQGLDVNQPDARGVSALFAQADSSATYPETPQRYPGKVRLLISLGADVHQRSPSAAGGASTALHIAAFRGAGAAVETLLESGAEADALDGQGRTALERVVGRANLRTLDLLAGVAAPLVAAGARITDEMREAVALLGREVAAVGPGSSAEHAARRAAAYDPVARLFAVETTPDDTTRDTTHGDTARGDTARGGPTADTTTSEATTPNVTTPNVTTPNVTTPNVTTPDVTASDPTAEILVPRASPRAQHRALWHALVPAAGHAPTVQGEVIRASGRIGHELLEMGGVNWDEDYRVMLAHLPVLLTLGVPLHDAALARARESARRLSTGRHTRDSERHVTELQQAAVAWVSLNTTPIPLQAPPYHR